MAWGRRDGPPNSVDRQNSSSICIPWLAAKTLASFLSTTSLRGVPFLWLARYRATVSASVFTTTSPFMRTTTSATFGRHASLPGVVHLHRRSFTLSTAT